MAAANPSVPTAPLREVASIWLKHLACFVLPATTLAFLASAPHRWWASLPWLAVVIVSVEIDKRASAELRQPAENLPAAPFDFMLYVSVALQVSNVCLAAWMVSQHGFFAVDTLTAVLLVGVTSGYSGIVAGHELIHRRESHLRFLGRLLMCSVMYEHFYTEHIRGHHLRVGTAEDPATARFGETFHQFWRRTVPGQFKSAWRLETKRLGDEEMSLLDRRQLGNRVLHGLVAEWSFAFTLLALLGVGAFAFQLLQSLAAVRLLEAVNYFEHWGLTRGGKRVTPVDSWDTDSWFTLYTLVGLSRHADHHAFAARPYPQLRHWEESPKLPSGYFGMVEMVLFKNREFRRLMTAELERRQLGPFAEGASAQLDAATSAA